MQFDLFNQALLLTVSFLTFLALAYSLLKNPVIRPVRKLKPGGRKKPQRRPLPHVAIIIAASVIFGLGLHAAVQAQFPQDDIPWESVIWAMPLGAAIVLLGYNIRLLWPALACAGGIVSGVALTLLLANNYYHYYPTLGALFDQNKTVAASETATTKAAASETVLENYYKPLANQPATGELQKLDIPASGAFAPRQGRIYLPPALHGNTRIRLPVVVLLAGYPGKPLDWEQAGLFAIMNDFALKHKGLAPVVAVVDFEGDKDVDTECVDSKLGASETYLAKDVPNYLKTHYQVSSSASDWTIAGYSAGGTCSTLVALRNPSVYQNFINVSGDAYPSLKTPAETLSTLFDGSQANQDAHTPNLLLQKGNPLYASMNGWYFVGRQDNSASLARIRNQAELAAKAGLTVTEKSMDGHHSFLVWKEGFVAGLPWVMNRIGLTAREK